MNQEVSRKELTQLLDFYMGNTSDSQERKIEEIWSWGYSRLEQIHDYIQWLFPLREFSNFNPDAPMLTAKEVEIFKSNKQLQDRVLNSLDLMLNFYGYSRLGNENNVQIVAGGNFDIRIRNWITPNNHNFLRITRILKSLSILGILGCAEKFLAALESLSLKEKSIISETSFHYWQSALKAR
jgi:Opioid growth factor receptor (OGFr) conserved region